MPKIALRKPIVVTVNGRKWTLDVEPSCSLLDVLRDNLNLTSAKRACDDGQCGSCTVLLGNKGVMSCLLPVSRAQGKEITTLEGLSQNGGMHVLQEAFAEHGASQCGFCIPGMIMQSEALLRHNPKPTRDDVVKHLARNICRCTGYQKIVDAVLYAAELKHNGKRSGRRPSEGKEGKVVGERGYRLDDADKLTGRAKYGVDLKREGMLFGKMLRSPHHHAEILSIDTSEAKALPGVEAVLTIKDIPGDPTTVNLGPQVTIFASDKVRFVGEVVAAVAAVSQEIAEEAVKRIKVEYEPLLPVLDPLHANDEGAPLINPPAPNVVLAKKLTHGNVAQGFAQADVVVENTYTTPFHEHFYMEPESGVAYTDDSGQLTVEFATYVPHTARDFIARLLGIDKEKVRVICPVMGGNFGGRSDCHHGGLLALLAFKTKKPVKLVYTREESLLGSPKWFSYHMKYKTGATRDGRLIALEAEIVGNGGCWSHYPGEPIGDIFVRHIFAATGPYKVPNVSITAYEACINSPRCIAMRGIGATPTAFAMDSQLDMIANKLGIDPLEIRLRNALQQGDSLHTGHILKESVGMKAGLEALREPYEKAQALANSAPPESPWKRGIGLGCGWRSVGASSGSYSYYEGIKRRDVTKAAVELLEDGRVHIISGAVEEGQGSTTAFAQMASEELGVPLERITLTLGDTKAGEYPHPTAAQGTIMLAGGGVQDASKRLKKALVQAASEVLEETPENIRLAGGYAFSSQVPAEKLSFEKLASHLREEALPTKYEGAYLWPHIGIVDKETGDLPYSLISEVFSYNAALSEVDVNSKTGQVKVRRITYAADSGTIISPLVFEGQCEGGVVFGLGLALKEQFLPGKTKTIKEYGLATIQDAPEKITVISVPHPYSKGPYGAKGGGEVSDVPVPASLLNAIANATGTRVFDIPARPEKVLEALNKKRTVKQ